MILHALGTSQFRAVYKTMHCLLYLARVLTQLFLQSERNIIFLSDLRDFFTGLAGGNRGFLYARNNVSLNESQILL